MKQKEAVLLVLVLLLPPVVLLVNVYWALSYIMKLQRSVVAFFMGIIYSSTFGIHTESAYAENYKLEA